MLPSPSRSGTEEGTESWHDEWNGLNETPRSRAEPHQSAEKSTSPTEAHLSGAEEYELSDDAGDWARNVHGHARRRVRTKYRDGMNINWWHEDAAERERWKALLAQQGLRGLLSPLVEAAKMWLVIVVMGIGLGLLGGWLDVLVKWLGDLREGRCTHSIFYNSVACCSGFDPGEVCKEWKSWSENFGVQSILGSSLLQSFIYMALSVAFSASASFLVVTYAPYAFHTGIPEIKAILGGYVFDSFLSAWTLLIKALGLALAVASGLSLGKEGPLVHVACSLAFLLSQMFVQFRQNEAHKRKLLAAAAAAGVSVAFGSPLGGVLFGLEELDTFAHDPDVMWRGFVTSVIAAVALQYVDPFGTSKLVLFQVTNEGDTWRAFELVPWLCLAVIGGALGALLIKLNTAAAVYRRNSVLNDWPILEVVCATAITAAISYEVVFLRVQSSELVANLFQDCDPARGDFHGLCNPTAMWENVFLLILTAIVKVGLTAWTFGMRVPAGIFLPTIAIGASLGRAVGLLVQGLHRTYPKAWIFSACPPDPSVRCVSPGFYAVIGASAMLGGVTRMTISLVVILFELTGALSHVLPIMICVMVSKWVGDAFGKEGIYVTWIAMRRYPWLAPAEHRDSGEVAAQYMIPVRSLIVLDSGVTTLGELERILQTWDYRGFPVTVDGKLLGYAARDQLATFIAPLSAEMGASERVVTFRKGLAGDAIDLSPVLEDVLQLRKDAPLELVVNMFRKMNLLYLMFSEAGRLTGMITKSDVVALTMAHFPHTAALVEKPDTELEG